MTAFKLYQTKHYSFMVSALFFFYFEMCWLNTEDAGATSLTISIPRALSLDIAPGTEPTFKKSAPATFSVRSDAPYGYELNIKAKDAAQGNRLVNGAASLTSIPSALSEAQYQAPGHNNTWAYLPNKLNSSPNANFQPGPTGTNTLLDRTTSANPATNSYSITLATKLDASIPSGAYQNTFILTASANAVTYRINYNLNSGTGGPSPNPQTGSTFDASVNLSPEIPTRYRYVFHGWCSVATTNYQCSGTTYQPNSPYPISAGSNDITLWAMWLEENYMQDYICWDDLDMEIPTPLIDRRNGNIYNTARLLDGHCWMTEDLQITNKNLTLSDSNINTNFTLPGSVGTSESFNNIDSPQLYKHPTRGVYYNWPAATAGQGTSQKTSGAVYNSICPRGWTIPSKEAFEKLINAYSRKPEGAVVALRANLINFNLSGRYIDGSFYSFDSEGYYWSATAYSRTNAYVFYISNSSVNLVHTYGKGNGFKIRCYAPEYSGPAV